jgi:hypothetical protein
MPSRISRIRELIHQAINAPIAMRRRFTAIMLQLERMEDKISRIEDGLEAAGMLSKESRLKQRNLNPENLSLEDSFDYIYLHRLWDTSAASPSSGTGSYGPWAERFVELAQTFIREHKIHSITDIGCGDFNVGSQLCPLVDRYNALDISREIIRVNSERFSALTQVTFRQANACADALPQADLAIIRQVLQHLSNAQVEMILQNIARTGFRFALIAEHLPLDDKLVKPNLDLNTQSNSIRLTVGSGLYLDQPPFSRPVKRIAQFEGEGGQLCVYLWDLSASGPVTKP